MSDQLYRIQSLAEMNGLTPPYFVVRQANLIDDPVVGQLVSVEPCQHGNYSRHAVTRAGYSGSIADAKRWDIWWCSGKPLNGTDDAYQTTQYNDERPQPT